jgi:tetratricopeptide (TPR) repeat protein
MPLPLVIVGAAAATVGWLVYRGGRRRPTSREDPGDPLTWRARLEAAAAAEDWPEVLRAHRKLADLGRGDERVAQLLLAARVAEERLQDADTATTLYDEVLLINPEDSEALAGLAFLRG